MSTTTTAPSATAVAKTTTAPPSTSGNPRREAYQKTPKTTIEIPTSAFYVPNEWEYAMNMTYWNGWLACADFQCTGVILLPSPEGTGSYENYSALFAPYYLPSSTYGYPNQSAVGWNNAITQGKNYVWQHDPQSPYFIPS